MLFISIFVFIFISFVDILCWTWTWIYAIHNLHKFAFECVSFQRKHRNWLTTILIKCGMSSTCYRQTWGKNNAKKESKKGTREFGQWTQNRSNFFNDKITRTENFLIEMCQCYIAIYTLHIMRRHTSGNRTVLLRHGLFFWSDNNG